MLSPSNLPAPPPPGFLAPAAFAFVPQLPNDAEEDEPEHLGLSFTVGKKRAEGRKSG
jgi:hypothetical protein